MEDKEIWERYIKGELPEIDLGIDTDEYENEAEELILDLHNHTEDQAYTAVYNIVRKAKELPCTKIRIITGRGSNYPITPGKLFTIVPKWLEVMQDANEIQSFRNEDPGEVIVKL